MPPVPAGPALRAAIDHHFWLVLTPEERADPIWNPDDEPAWAAFLARQRATRIVAYDGPAWDTSSSRRRRWWGVPGRTIVRVIAHINAGNNPPLRMPPPYN